MLKPIQLIWIYKKLSEKTVNGYLTGKQVTETIQRVALTPKSGGNNGKGGSRKGLPRCHLYDVVTDLINYRLLIKHSHHKYQLVDRQDLISDLNRLKKFPF